MKVDPWIVQIAGKLYNVHVEEGTIKNPRSFYNSIGGLAHREFSKEIMKHYETVG